MIKNNPFITIILLFLIEVVLFIYIDYLNIFSADNEDLVLVILFFSIPVIAILLRIFLVDEPYKKSFKYFTFKLFTNKPAESELSKNGQVIPLKNTFPDNPIKYVD